MASKPDLVEAYFDRELTPEETCALRAWLRASEANRASFAKDSLLYLGLKDTLQELSLSDGINDMQLVSSLDEPDAEGKRASLQDMLDLLDPGEDPLPLVDITPRILAESALARQQAHEAQLAKARAAHQPKEKKPVVIVIPPWLAYGSAIAAVVALAFVILANLPDQSSQSGPPQQAENPPARDTPEPVPAPIYATIVSQVDARWANAGRAATVGTTFEAGSVQLVEGMVQLEYANGAVLTLQAPVSLRFDDESRVYLETGNLYARSEHDQLVVGTPYGIVTDLGTAFGVVVSSAGELEAHVYEGLVRVSNEATPEQPAVELVRGQAVQLDHAGQFQRIQADDLAVVSEVEYSVNQRAAEGDAQAAWLAHAYALRRNPNLLLYLSPSSAEDAGLAVTANLASGLPEERDWQSSTEGRAGRAREFSGRDAVVFDFPDDKLAYELPESYTQLTMSAWVNLRNQGANRDLRGLVMAHGEVQGDLHWQLKREPDSQWSLHMGVSGGRTRLGDFPFENVELHLGQSPFSDRWVHLTTVIDTERGTVRMFVDGDFVGESPMPQPGPVRLGRVVVGNWDTIATAGSPMRYLGGGISELFVFDVTLSDSQVKELYEQTVRP